MGTKEMAESSGVAAGEGIRRLGGARPGKGLPEESAAHLGSSAHAF